MNYKIVREFKDEMPTITYNNKSWFVEKFFILDEKLCVEMKLAKECKGCLNHDMRLFESFDAADRVYLIKCKERGYPLKDESLDIEFNLY